ncbi:MAG TPA: GNAT family N-acetyltransferase [Acidobacteriota bacterium]|nr:GNAT family N-acetyltransferase [Acidobacteriota bacterium]
MSSNLKCRFIHSYAELVTLSSTWDDLVCKSDFPDLFATSGFAKAWWRAYGSDLNMNVAVVEDSSGNLRLIAPFQSAKKTPKQWELIGRPRGDYNNFIMAASDRESLKCLFDWLDSQHNWDTLIIRRIPGKATLLRYFDRPYNGNLSKVEKVLHWMKLGSWLVYQEPRHEHPVCNGTTFQEMHDVLNHIHHRRKTKWLNTQGELKYLVITDPEAIKKDWLPKFFELHVMEWSKMLEKGSFLRHQIHRDFYNYIVEEMACYNALRFDAMTLNDSLLAAHLGFHWAGRLYYWLACYDSNYSKGSPGRLLLGNIIHSALELGLTELDMLFGLENYKKDFWSEIRETGAMTIYRSPIVAARVQQRWHPKWYLRRE